MKINLVFQGGGARGIFHVGALKALEDIKEDPKLDIDMEICGTAGTSAGAIIAALVAVGFKARELVDENGNIQGVGSGHDIPLHFLTKRQWLSIRFVRDYLRSMYDDSRSKKFFYKVTVYILFLIILFELFIFFSLYYLINGMDEHILIIPFMLINTFILTIIYRNAPSGLASLDKFGSKLNEILVNKICSDQKIVDEGIRKSLLESGLTFSHLREYGCISDLKIIATNVDDGIVKIFSCEETPDIPIYLAIMASVAVPIVFRPVHIEGKIYYDGGIMSNKPAWVFDFERIKDPDLRTIIFDIERGYTKEEIARQKEKPIQVRRGGGLLLWALYRSVYSGITGTKPLEIKPSSRNILVEISPSGVGLLDFELGATSIASAMRHGETVARVEILERLLFHIEETRNAVEKIKKSFKIIRRATLKKNVNEGKIRIYVSNAHEDFSILRNYFSSDGKSTADRLFLPLNDTLAGEAFNQRKAICFRRNEYVRRNFQLPMNRYRKALKHQDGLALWYAYIPIWFGKEKKTFRLIAIESMTPLREYGLDRNCEGELWNSIISVCTTSFQKVIDFEYLKELRVEERVET